MESDTVNFLRFTRARQHTKHCFPVHQGWVGSGHEGVQQASSHIGLNRTVRKLKPFLVCCDLDVRVRWRTRCESSTRNARGLKSGERRSIDCDHVITAWLGHCLAE